MGTLGVLCCERGFLFVLFEKFLREFLIVLCLSIGGKTDATKFPLYCGWYVEVLKM